jgi:hypothetical protein
MLFAKFVGNRIVLSRD